VKIETAMKYPNAAINQYDLATGKKVSDYKNILNFIYFDGATFLNLKDMSSELNNCKLQLRPLSSLTDEEKEYIHDNFIVKGLSTVRIYETLESMLNHCYANTKHKLIDYLRSINIDIDNLIESAEAEVCEK
jgi:hypothetical protein